MKATALRSGDQQSLYGGTRWPKALGEAIRANDFFLLCWSEQARASHFVELEWNTALALKKPIIPFLLDTTPLPPVLSSIHGVDAVEAVLNALAETVSPAKAEEQEAVIRKLEAVTETDPAKIVEVVRATFYQPGMHVGGSVFNVAGDFVAGTTDTSRRKKPLEKWLAWAALVVALLTVLTLLLDLPGKIQGLFVSDEPTPTAHLFTGIIKDRVTGNLLPGVVVHILDVTELEGDTLTDHLGHFSFTFETLKPFVELEGNREGYQRLRQNVTLTPPTTHTTFPMTPLLP